MDMQHQMVQALKAGDSDKVQRVYDLATAWDELYPEMPLRLSPSVIRRQLVLSGMNLNERTLKMLPRALRGTSLAAEGVGSTE
ncbi:hypothetical protein HY346_00840 [Candidatus Microgenomates bacterium]|nr:hypothetical protein [Candidatus Microgenomates bacterium]